MRLSATTRSAANKGNLVLQLTLLALFDLGSSGQPWLQFATERRAAYRSIPISETGSALSAQSLGSRPGSLRSAESDPSTWTLPTLPWRDWELNLDDLRVCITILRN